MTTTYEYDALGQLTRVNDPNDPTAYNEGGLSNNGTTWIYAYDRGGHGDVELPVWQVLLTHPDTKLVSGEGIQVNR